MRRTQSQLDLINKDEFSPFKSPARDHGWYIQSKSISKYNAGIYTGTRDLNGEIVYDNIPRGYTAALTTISNLRGFSAEEVEILIYDEFIPEHHEKPIKEEGAAFMNAYETVNRNRELEGKRPPLLFLGLANANNLGNPIFMELGLVEKAEKMKRSGQEICILKERGIGIYMLDNSKISEQKQSTALYKLAQRDSMFSQMALSNRFAEISDEVIGRVNLKEYRPIVTMGEITVYKHKSSKIYYISHHASGSPAVYNTSEVERERCFRLYNFLWEAYMKNRIKFEDSSCEIYFNNYFK